MTKASKVRLRFAKCGDLRLVSHHDLMRCLERMLRRAEFPIAMSQGFNPRPKITFALALGLGIEGLREVVDLELSEPLDLSDIVGRLRAVAPPGFDWKDAHALPPNAPPPHPRTVEYSFPVVAERREVALSHLESLLACTSWPMTRHRPNRDVNYRLAHSSGGGRADDRGSAAFSFEGIPRRLRASGRTARGACASRPSGPRGSSHSN